MIEFELKFQLPRQRRRAVRSFVVGRGAQRSREVQLQAAYFDTPDRLLARHAIALRLRREGDGWVQTLKGGGGDGTARKEHNVPLDAGLIDFAAPQVDPSRHAGVDIGDCLIDLLAGDSGGELGCRFRTDVRRTLRELSTRFGKVELAFDEGFLEAGDRRQPLCELEIELLSGDPRAVLDVARRWALRFGLWLDVRSKAERGDMLARGVDVAQARKAGNVRLDGGASALVSLQTVVADCRAQIFANASQVASGLYEAEHVHQLRVGLRRLRTALRLFDSEPDAATIAGRLAEPAARLFRALGPARDRAVLAGPLSASIAAAWRDAGQADQLPQWTSRPLPAAPAALLRDPENQLLLLDLIEVGLPAQPATDRQAKKLPKQRRTTDLLARRLSKWHAAVLRDAAAFEQLDDAGRHRLRKRLKRLVYGAGFASRLFKRKPMRRLMASLKPLQECLGELNDLAGGRDAIAGTNGIDWFAIGWMSARRQALLAEIASLLQQVDTRQRLWKRRSKAGRR
ncbi:CHAD domain-containing protein [Piscinibacter sakaiensis]|uniref:CYTH and CHAD domain-containing protein n=1 Tax=Piscinibacter sakaiensis TaxID=1547922 RepID=UPI003AAF7BD0